MTAIVDQILLDSSHNMSVQGKSGFGTKRHLVRTMYGCYISSPEESPMALIKAKSERIELRTTPGTKALLLRAAASMHKNITEFLLEAGINAAEETLIERRLFQLDDEQWQAFQEVMDRPVVSKPRLAKLLAEKSVLE